MSRDKEEGEMITSSDETKPWGWTRPTDSERIRALEAELAAVRQELAEANKDSERLASLLPLLEYMRGPLEAARRNARPSAGPPVNVEVSWRTGSDTVVELLNLLDAARAAEESDAD